VSLRKSNFIRITRKSTGEPWRLILNTLGGKEKTLKKREHFVDQRWAIEGCQVVEKSAEDGRSVEKGGVRSRSHARETEGTEKRGSQRKEALRGGEDTQSNVHTAGCGRCEQLKKKRVWKSKPLAGGVEVRSFLGGRGKRSEGWNSIAGQVGGGFRPLGGT